MSLQMHFVITWQLNLRLVLHHRILWLFLLFHQQQIFLQLRPSQSLRDCLFHRIVVLRCPFLRKQHHVHLTRHVVLHLTSNFSHSQKHNLYTAPMLQYESILCSRFVAIEAVYKSKACYSFVLLYLIDVFYMQQNFLFILIFYSQVFCRFPHLCNNLFPKNHLHKLYFLQVPYPHKKDSYVSDTFCLSLQIAI